MLLLMRYWLSLQHTASHPSSATLCIRVERCVISIEKRLMEQLPPTLIRGYYDPEEEIDLDEEIWV